MAKNPLKGFDKIYYNKILRIEEEYLDRFPKTLYHYTNLKAFQNILIGKHLWASRVEFLNDAREYKYGKEILGRIASSLKKRKKYRKIVERLLAEISDRSPYVVCFCSDGDLLSQWRGYSSHGQGIAVGFKSDKLDSIKDTDLHTVVYDPHVQGKLIEAQIAALADSLRAVDADLDNPRVRTEIEGQAGLTELYCALLKDPALREESEIRLLLRDFMNDDGSYTVKFRDRNNLIVPYVEVAVTKKRWEGVIEEVVLGPGPDPEDRRTNIEHFFSLLGLKGIKVRISSAQFRQ